MEKTDAYVFEIDFPGDLEYIPPVRKFVSEVLQSNNFGPKFAYRSEIIVDEICNNAVEHGLANSSAPIDLSIRIDRKKIEIKVMGPSDPVKIECLKELLKPLQHADAEAPLDQKRGRGLTLIKMLSNELNIDFSENGTSVSVTKLKEE